MVESGIQDMHVHVLVVLWHDGRIQDIQDTFLVYMGSCGNTGKARLIAVYINIGAWHTHACSGCAVASDWLGERYNLLNTC